MIGGDIEKGLIPDNDELAGPMIRNICYRNAKDYLNLDD
jgi:glucuronate isomerase